MLATAFKSSCSAISFCVAVTVIVSSAHVLRVSAKSRAIRVVTCVFIRHKMFECYTIFRHKPFLVNFTFKYRAKHCFISNLCKKAKNACKRLAFWKKCCNFARFICFLETKLFKI